MIVTKAGPKCLEHFPPIVKVRLFSKLVKTPEAISGF